MTTKQQSVEFVAALISDRPDLYPAPEFDTGASFECAENLADLAIAYSDTPDFEGVDLEDITAIVHEAYRRVYNCE